MNSMINIVFMPVSTSKGMASSMRLRNFVNIIKSEEIICKNIITIYKDFDSSLKNNNTAFVKKSSLIPDFITFQVLIHLLKFKIKGKNLLYYYGYPQIKNIVYLVFAKLLGYKIIFDIVEDNAKIKNYKSILAKLRIKSSLFFFKRIEKLANGIIVINDNLFKVVKQYVSLKTPIIKIPISIDLNEYKVILPKENYYIYYGGSFGVKDGLIYLLKAFDKIFDEFPKSKLILSGKGNTKDMKNFEIELSKIKNKDQVIFKGYLSREEYISLLQNSAVLCMCRTNSPFANAGFPFKLGEMLASGSPVIITKVGNIQKYIKNRENAILISPDNVHELYTAIKYLFKNRENALYIGLQGRITADKYFNLNKHKKQILEFLYNV